MALTHHFKMHFKILSAICFNLDQFEILSSGNGLNIIISFTSIQKQVLTAYTNLSRLWFLETTTVLTPSVSHYNNPDD